MTNKLQKALGRAFMNAIANDQAKKVGANDPEDTADDRADKPLQADLSQTEFKKNDRNSE